MTPFAPTDIYVDVSREPDIYVVQHGARISAMSKIARLDRVSTFRDSYAHVSIYGYSDMIVVREGVGTPAFASLAIFY